MILFDTDIKNIKYLVNEMRRRAVSDCNIDVVTFCDQVLYLADRYQDDCDNYHDKYERKAYSFLMRFADDIGSTNTYKSKDFKKRFFNRLSCYKALDDKFHERLKGGN